MKPFLPVLVALLLAQSFLTVAGVSPLGGEFQINTHTTRSQSHPAVAMSDAGDFVVVWVSNGQDATYTGGIFAQLFDSTGGFVGIEFQVNTYTTGEQIFPAVAMSETGEFVVVWQSDDQDAPFTDGIFAQRFDSKGAPLSSEFQVNSYTTADQQLADVAMDASGRFVVVWEGFGQGSVGRGIFGRMFDAAGSPMGLDFQVNTYTGGGPRAVSVDMDPDGNFVVVWDSFHPSESLQGVFGQMFDSTGAPSGSEFRVNTYTTVAQQSPSVAMDAVGNFVVVWNSSIQDGSEEGIFGQRFNSAGAAVGSEFQVNTYTILSQSNASVAMLASGGFVVAWEGRGVGGSGRGIIAQLFDSSGIRVASEFQVNSSYPGSQQKAALSADTGGGFVAVWQTFSQDGDNLGVFGQRFKCADRDMDGLCDSQDVIITVPPAGATLDCGDPRTTRPTIEWTAGNYDRFRVFIGSSPAFERGTRISSGNSWLRDTSWTPGRKRWRRACRKAVAADPFNPNPALYIRVRGKDRELRKKDPNRRTYSQVVQVEVQL
jgi:hypothetical protein